MTAWILATMLAALLLLALALYRRSIRETRHLVTYTLFILMDEGVYKAQRGSLQEFISSTKAANALDLSTKVHTATLQLADQLADKITLGCHAAIWQFYQRGAQ